MTGTVAICKFFVTDGDKTTRPGTREIKELSTEDRHELGRLACEALGEEYDVPKVHAPIKSSDADTNR